MKKIILALLLIVLTGCSNDCPECEVCEPCNNDEEILSAKAEELKNKLLEYGKLIYENDNWLNGNIEAGTYFMTLSEMSERNGYDISMFVNPITNETCDLENTRIEFIVESSTDTETQYSYNTVLDCGNMN